MNPRQPPTGCLSDDKTNPLPSQWKAPTLGSGSQLLTTVRSFAAEFAGLPRNVLFTGGCAVWSLWYCSGKRSRPTKNKVHLRGNCVVSLLRCLASDCGELSHFVNAGISKQSQRVHPHDHRLSQGFITKSCTTHAVHLVSHMSKNTNDSNATRPGIHSLCADCDCAPVETVARDLGRFRRKKLKL